MKKSLVVLMLLASTSLFAEVHFSVGIGVGPAIGYYAAPPPPAPRLPAVAYYPPSPGPGYVWVSGYYNRLGPRYVWRAGYWSRPPYAGAVWVGPRYVGHRYFNGHWRRR